MKKIFFSIFLASALLTSCDMNEQPAGTLSDENAISSEKDALRFRNGIYNGIRSLTAGTVISYPDIQADQFIGTMVNGNRIGIISAGNFTSSDRDLAGFWAGAYGCIADVNYYLPKVENLLAGDVTAAQAVQLKRYRGEAHWARAFYYYMLTEKYCNSYVVIDPTAADTGVPLVKEYNPSGDYSSYPGRASLADVYAFMEEDLAQAYTDLEAFENSDAADATAYLAPNADYLSTYAVMALQARIALLKGDYTTALDKAEKVIAGPFDLCDPDEYFDMWQLDEGDELIFVPFGNLDQNASVPDTGAAWLSNSQGIYDYVPTSSMLALYDDYDIRLLSFFEPQLLTSDSGEAIVPSFIKFPGNPEFNTGSSNAFRNKPKPFRLSEMYLIVAEAVAMGPSTDKSKANNALNKLRKYRIDNYTDQTYGGTTLIDEIRKERAKELIGEGFRISDLRRWGLGFTRTANYVNEYEDVPTILVQVSLNNSYTPGDYRYVLPIPSDEMDANPQLKGHQNPGY